MPDVTGRRFITLTLDRNQFGHCPLTGYLKAKDHLRRFLEAGRLCGLWDRGCWWAWKMEFQADGWAHWHLLLDRTRKFTLEEMRTIDRIWGMGRTNVRRISKSTFGYQFKYAFKGVFQEDSDGSGLCVPQWFLDFYKKGKDGQKPMSFARVRFWQTSKGFYVDPPKPQPPPSDQQSCHVPRPVSEVLSDRQASILVCARRSDGKYVTSRRLKLGVDHEKFIRVHLWDADNGYGCTLSARSFALAPETITKLIESTQQWQLKRLLQHNRLTLPAALRLRQSRQSLETC